MIQIQTNGLPIGVIRLLINENKFAGHILPAGGGVCRATCIVGDSRIGADRSANRSPTKLDFSTNERQSFSP